MGRGNWCVAWSRLIKKNTSGVVHIFLSIPFKDELICRLHISTRGIQFTERAISESQSVMFQVATREMSVSARNRT